MKKDIAITILVLVVLSVIVCQTYNAVCDLVHEYKESRVPEHFGAVDNWYFVARKGAATLSLRDDASGDVVVPDYVEVNGEEYKVTAIMERENPEIKQTLLTGVSGGTWLTNIYGRAFYDCTALQSVSLPNASGIFGNAFEGSVSLTSVSLPNVILGGDRMFADCFSLTNVSLPKIEFIGDGTFSDCYALRSLILGDLCTFDAIELGLPKTVRTITVPQSSYDHWKQWEKELLEQRYNIRIVFVD